MVQTRYSGVEMLERLVAFDTVSRNSNLELVEFVRGYLDELGVPYTVTYDGERRKANVFATIGPADRPGIILSGHTDVVPVDGQAWDTDPFRLTERDGKLYGRGACDMKGYDAVMLAMVPRFLEADLKTPIHLALSYDEEVGCIGVRQMIADLERAELKPIACIVGEPSSMQPITGHKGAKTMRCEVRGFEVHSSLAPRGVNAVEAAAELITHLKSMARRTAKSGPFVEGFDPPHTTVHTGPIQGGTAHNIVPKDCVFTFEFRVVPGDDPEALFAEVESVARTRIEPEMKAIEPGTGIHFFDRSSYPGLATSEDAEVTSLVKSLTGANRAGKVSYGTEAGLFAAAGIPSIICGPGSIEQAHKPNEFVTRAQMDECERFLWRLCERLSG